MIRKEKCHICGGTGEILVTDWLTRGMTEEEIAAEKKASLADIVCVVRCKDCKHYRAYEPPIEDFDGRCSINENEYDKDFYCQYGERREENEG